MTLQSWPWNLHAEDPWNLHAKDPGKIQWMRRIIQVKNKIKCQHQVFQQNRILKRLSHSELDLHRGSAQMKRRDHLTRTSTFNCLYTTKPISKPTRTVKWVVRVQSYQPLEWVMMLIRTKAHNQSWWLDVHQHWIPPRWNLFWKWASLDRLWWENKHQVGEAA